MISIWYKHEHHPTEKIDAVDKKDLLSTLFNYRDSFACNPGQDRYGKDIIWSGYKKDMPQLPKIGI